MFCPFAVYAISATADPEADTTELSDDQGGDVGIGRFTEWSVGIGAVAAMLGYQALSATSAQAYYGPNAVNYAEFWWPGNNTNYPIFYGNDCTNFVSQSLRSGGIPVTNATGNWDPNDNHNWWDLTSQEWVSVYPYPNPTYQNSRSAAVAANLKSFLVDSGHGVSEGTFTYWNAPSNPAGMFGGDVFFYSWLGDGTINHNSIKVGNGTDVHGWTGDWVDQHDSHTDYHNNWSDLDDGDTNWAITTIYAFHIQ